MPLILRSALAILALGLRAAAAGDAAVPADIALPDAAGIRHSLREYASSKAVVLIVQGNGCPISRQSAPAIHRLRERFGSRGVTFLLLNASPQDDATAIAQEVAEHAFGIPVLIDRRQDLARALGVSRTAEAFLLEPGTWRTLYRGALDDRLTYGAQRTDATRHFLADALEDHLAGRPVATPRTEALGCLVQMEPEEPPADPAPLPPRAEDFVLLDVQGRRWQLRSAPASEVTLFSYALGCPASRAALPALKREAAAGKTVWLIESGGARRDELAREAAELDIALPLLHDASGMIGWGLGFRRGGDQLVVNLATLEISTRAASSEAGLPLPPPPTDLSFTRDVAPVLREHCIGCHQAEQKGISFEDTASLPGWAPMIRETVRMRRMPPNAPDVSWGPYRVRRALTHAETRTLLSWAESGANVDYAEPRLSFKRRLPEGGPILSFHAPPRSPALKPETRYEPLAPVVEEDLLVRSAAVRFSTSAGLALHHTNVHFFPDEARRGDRRPLRAFISTDPSVRLVGPDYIEFPGFAYRIPAGSRLALESHFEPSGVPVPDDAYAVLNLHTGPPPREVHQMECENPDLVIAPGDPAYQTSAACRLEQDIEIVWLFLHMHCRGRRISLSAVLPSGERTGLISVPDFRCRAVNFYHMIDPIRLPAGTILELKGEYDNSAANPLNPDPTAEVRYGALASAEMLQIRMGFTAPRAPEAVPVPKPESPSVPKEAPQIAPK